MSTEIQLFVHCGQLIYVLYKYKNSLECVAFEMQTVLYPNSFNQYYMA